MKLQRKYQKTLTTIIFVFIMSMVISFAMVTFRLGFTSEWLQVWLQSWGLAFMVALPSADDGSRGWHGDAKNRMGRLTPFFHSYVKSCLKNCSDSFF